MYYEERWENGILYRRFMPNAAWEHVPYDVISQRLHTAENTVQALREELDWANGHRPDRYEQPNKQLSTKATQ